MGLFLYHSFAILFTVQLAMSLLAALGMLSLKVVLEIALYHTQLQHHAFTCPCAPLQQCNSGSN